MLKNAWIFAKKNQCAISSLLQSLRIHVQDLVIVYSSQLRHAQTALQEEMNVKVRDINAFKRWSLSGAENVNSL